MYGDFWQISEIGKFFKKLCNAIIQILLVFSYFLFFSFSDSLKKARNNSSISSVLSMYRFFAAIFYRLYTWDRAISSIFLEISPTRNPLAWFSRSITWSTSHKNNENREFRQWVAKIKKKPLFSPISLESDKKLSNSKDSSLMDKCKPIINT